MDTVVSGFSGVGRVFSYVGLVFGILAGIALIAGGSYVLSNDNYVSVTAKVVTPSPLPTVVYTYEGQQYNSILYNTQNGIFYTPLQSINVFIRSSDPGTAYAQPQPKTLGIGLIVGGFVVMAVGMLNTYFVRKNPGYAAVVGFADVIGMNRRHSLYGLI